MRLLKFFVAIAALGVILTAIGSSGSTGSVATRDRRGLTADDEEPVLGYDGMDPDTLIPWLESADLDDAALERIRRYETTHHGRQRVLEAIDDLLG